jgi:hypothetical protein
MTTNVPHKNIPVDEEAAIELRRLYESEKIRTREKLDAFSQQIDTYNDAHTRQTMSATQTIGIIAGLGFTAAARVEVLWIFMLGEILIVGSMCFSQIRNRVTITKIIQSLWSSGDKATVVLSKNLTYFDQVAAQANSTRTVPTDIKERIEELLNERDTIVPKTRSSYKDYFAESIVVAGIGVVLVITSFLNFPWLHIHYWISAL